MDSFETTWVRSIVDPWRVHVPVSDLAPYEPPRALCGASPTGEEARNPDDVELTRCAPCSLLLEGHAQRPPRTIREWIERECADNDEELPAELCVLRADGVDDDAAANRARRVLDQLVTGLTRQYVEVENTLRAVRELRGHSERARTISADLTETLVALEVAFRGLGHAESVLLRGTHR